MLPLRDSEAERRIVPATTLLIVINFAMFVAEARLALHGSAEFMRYAMVPAHLAQLHPAPAELAALATLITALFLHAGVLHLAGNMLYLLIFGPAVELRMGHRRFLAFYLIAGVVSGLATVLMAPASMVPVIGASGAIAGVLGGYLVLFPRGRITTLWFYGLIEVPAVLYLMLWFALQLYSAIATGPQTADVGGVAWWAHIGGFLFGLAATPFLATHIQRRALPARRSYRRSE